MAAHWCLSTLQRIASDLSIYEDGRRIGLDVLDAFQVQLEQVYREVTCTELISGLSDHVLVGVDVPQGQGTINLVLAPINNPQSP